MTLVLHLERTDLAHLVQALGRYDADLRRDALRLPRALTDLRTMALAEVREGQRGAESPDLGTLPQSHIVGPLTVTYDRAAEVLSVSTSTVKRLVSTGRLPVVEVAGAPRVRVADLDEYVEHLEPRDPTGPRGAPPDLGP